MKKEVFLERLEALLQDIPEEEKRIAYMERWCGIYQLQRLDLKI